jgi:prepilin-type N-terminal cleavage/methylation domain-containing protein
MRRPEDAGFTVVEMLVATAILVCGIAGLSYVAAVAVRQTATARGETMALLLAQSKLEELRAAPWAFDPLGARVSAPELMASPASALDADATGYADQTDVAGTLLDTRTDRRVVFRRRWLVAVDLGDADTLWLKVCVESVGSVRGRRRTLPEACVATARTRKR